MKYLGDKILIMYSILNVSNGSCKPVFLNTLPLSKMATKENFTDGLEKVFWRGKFTNIFSFNFASQNRVLFARKKVILYQNMETFDQTVQIINPTLFVMKQNWNKEKCSSRLQRSSSGTSLCACEKFVLTSRWVVTQSISSYFFVAWLVWSHVGHALAFFAVKWRPKVSKKTIYSQRTSESYFRLFYFYKLTDLLAWKISPVREEIVSFAVVFWNVTQCSPKARNRPQSCKQKRKRTWFGCE